MAHVVAGKLVVWVVDDSPLDAAKAERALVERYQVHSIFTGSEAIERLSTGQPPDALVLDWLMPDVSGLEVCRFVRERYPELPILLLTAQRGTEQVVQALDAGADDFLSKPYSEAELMARVGALVRNHELLLRARRAEQALTAVLEGAPDAIIALDDETRVRFVNSRASDVLHKPAAALIGCLASELLPGITQAELAGHGRVATVPLPDVCILDQIYEPILRPGIGGGLLRSVMALRNVTSRRSEEARRLDFYSKIAHDLRSPLAAMLTRTDLALAGKHGLLSAPLLSDMRSMQRNIREMVAMINDFLELTRYEGRGYDLELEPAALNHLVESVVEDVRPLAEASQLRVVTDLPNEPVVLLCDSRRIRQVLNNLLGNAIKFTPAKGQVCVQLNRDEQFVEVSVRDTGQGIDPKLLDRIFDRYVRAIDDQHNVTGTGLGLMIVREIVELHGGCVGVSSQPRVGSTFWFRLPSPTSAREFAARAG